MAGAPDRLSVIPADPLPPGWPGKLLALNCGVRRVEPKPDYFLFTNADIVHSRGNLVSLLCRGD
jgi:hypothetical protein